MAKERIDIPGPLAADVLFAHDHTCCVCQTPGKAVQVHHLNENPADNDRTNFAVLCLEDHNRSHLRGGFGRQLSALEIVVYRDNWIERVRARREKADQLAVASAIPTTVDADYSVLVEFDRNEVSEIRIVTYIKSLPQLRGIAIASARIFWDRGTTAQMRDGNAELIAALEGMCVRLASFYHPKHFDDMPASAYFSNMTADLYAWAYKIYELERPGHRGTLGPVIAGGIVIDRMSQYIDDLVDGIYFNLTNNDAFDPVRWRSEWKAAGQDDAIAEDGEESSRSPIPWSLRLVSGISAMLRRTTRKLG